MIILNEHIHDPWTNFAIHYEYDCFHTINVPWGYCLIRFNFVFVLFVFCFCFWFKVYIYVFFADVSKEGPQGRTVVF